MRKSLFIVLAVVVLLSSCGAEMMAENDEPANESKNTYGLVADFTDSTLKPVNVPETILVDDSGVKITAKGMEIDEVWGQELKLLIENNTEENITVTCKNESVNGFMVDGMLYAEIASGKKANESITFTNLSECGIETIADMEFSFHVSGTDDWETYLETDMIRLQTSAAEHYNYTFDDSGEVLYNGEGFKAVLKGFSKDVSYFGTEIIVYLENNYDVPITVHTQDVSVNGYMVAPTLYTEIMPGKKAVDEITIMESDMEENGITVIEEMELTFHVLNTETLDDVLKTELILVEFDS